MNHHARIGNLPAAHSTASEAPAWCRQFRCTEAELRTILSSLEDVSADRLEDYFRRKQELRRKE